jgi:hypothetical protein
MSRLWQHSCALLAGLAIASTLWAGKEFPALPGQVVVPGQLLVRYKPGTPTASVTSSLVPGSQAQPLASGLPDVYLVQLPAGTDPSFSTALSQNPSVDYVEPNRIRHITVQAPNDSLIQSQWALTNIQALQTWQLLPNVYLTSGTASAGRVKVAVIDTGADCTHPDFINAGGSSTDAALGGQLLFSLSHAFVATTIANPTCPWQDDFGHGTHVSGTVAAATNNAAGVASLGYPLQLIEYKVLDQSGNGTDLDVTNAIIAAADAGARVISMSLGDAGYSQTIQDAVNYAWQRNAVVVAAAGNSNTNSLFFPAGANNATGVAATDSNDAKASFSNFGPSVDIAAPGVGILSTKTTYATTLGGPLNYGSLDGTSMATPHVAALAGLIDMATPNLASMAVVQRIQQSADGVDGTVANGGWGQNMGYGRMNAYRAISVGNLRSASVGGFVGQVLDNTGTPVASATVMVVGQTSVTTDAGPSADGLFRIPNLAGGMTYTLVTSATGLAPVTMKAAVVAGADTTVTIVMGVTTGEFHGIVSDSGVPIPGAVVQALSAGLVKAAAVTDSTGAYSLLVAPGTFDLRASLMYGVTTTVTSKSVGANGSVAVNISIAKMGSISGTVSDSSMHPVANATITVTATGFSAGAITNAGGGYQTIGIPAGTYSVSVTAPGSFTGATVTGVVVTNDTVTPLNFTVNIVAVTTSPAGLTVTVDGNTYTAPQSFYFAPSSTHTIGVTSPQNSTGTRYTWSNWSDGGAMSHSVTGPFGPTYTATFSLQYLLTLAASPSGGGTLAANPTSSDGYYASGTSVQVTATANPNYQFANFSGDLTGATSPQSVAMTMPRSVTANYNVQTMVTTNPSGLAITVDGQNLTAPQTFSWAFGSSHTVAVSSPQNGAAGTRYAWSNWSDGGAVSHSVVTQGTPATYTANFTTQYLLTLAASPAGGGTLTANPSSADGYYANGTSVQVTASANSGYQFASFSGDLTGAISPQSVVMSTARAVTGNFDVAATVTTSPAGLSVIVDGTTFVAPHTFSWTPGSSHSVNVVSPQNGPAGTRYAWSSWSDGGAVSHSVIAAAAPTTYTATFGTQYLLTLAASPGAGGNLSPNPSSSDGYYATGTSVQVTASANAGYQFASFSGDLTGSTNSQSVTMSAARSVTANFNVQTIVATNPSGLAITVDGQSSTAPQTFNWTQGSSHTIAVSSPQNGPAGTHYVWSNWSDSGAISHSITTAAAPTTYTANFNTQYLLTLTTAPSGGGTLAANPTSSDGYYASGTSVQLTAAANSGFQFANFSGDLTGSSNPQSVVLNAARSVTANFNAQATVTTNPPGLSIIVDGQSLTAPQTFSWAQGTTHTIAVTSPQSGGAGMRSVWSSWSDGGAISHTVTAASTATTYTANFTTQYLLTLSAVPSAGGASAANPASSDGFYASGTSVQLTAAANAGFQFASFSGDLAGSVNPQSVVMSAARSVTANFNVQATVTTNPPGLGIIVDGQALTAPQTFNWAPGSGHTVAVGSPQNGAAGTRYAWSGWSDGGALSHTITMASSTATYTANFTTQYLLTLATSPSGGGSLVANPASADRYYSNGTSVQVAATANSGYQFGGFAGDLTGATNPQSVVMSAPRSVTGNFAALTGIVVSTNPPGLGFTVDGIAYTGTQNFSWVAGSMHTLAVNSPQNGAAGTRYAWANWSDGGAVSHTVTATSAPAAYTANFTAQYLLTLAASPAGGGSLAANPTSADGYYSQGASVQITATATAGFLFTGFAGDLNGSTNPQSVAMTAPRSVTGSFSGFSTLTVDRAKLNFGTANGIATSPQTIHVGIAAGVSWSASSNQPNISVSPSSGSGSGTFQVTAGAGPSGVVTVSSAGASGSPQIQVSVTAVASGTLFGSFDTPANNTPGVAGAIAVTGWALDSIEVTKVDIWRDPIAGEAAGPNGLVYIGDAVFVADARPDVEALYPSAPFNYRAGWGYLLLTNFLPNNNGGAGGSGNGAYNLHAIAHNKSGATLDLGTRTITVDNAHATKPFGTIDTPGQGGTASGSAYINFGWALTQNPNMIPFDGSTIAVYVDSVPVGHPTYNQFRSDIANLFPGHANSGGAVGFFYIDTTKLANGVHAISWTVFDNVGHGDGIGSRFFNVQNNGGGASTEPMHSLNVEAAEQTPVEIDQLGRVELQLGAVSGRLLVAGEQRPLPIGSTLKDGMFYWQPPAGFLGEYQLVFERGDGSATRVRIKVREAGTVYSNTNFKSRK